MTAAGGRPRLLWLSRTTQEPAERERTKARTPEEWVPVIMTVSPLWAVAMVIVAVVSAVDLTRAPNGDVGFHVAVGAVAVGAVALIWLPSLIRLLSITGGSLKAAGMEASAGGLLNTNELVKTLAGIKNETERAATSSSGGAEATAVAAKVNDEVNRIAENLLPPEEAINERALDAIARRYEEIRRTQPSGWERTLAMTRCVNEARVRAKAAPEAARRWAHRLLPSGAAGDRIVGLGLIQEAPDATAIDQVLPLFTNSASSFEAYQALVAIKRLARLLSPDERRRVAAAIEREKTDPRGTGLMNDPSLPGLIAETLKELSEPTPADQAPTAARSTAARRSSAT